MSTRAILIIRERNISKFILNVTKILYIYEFNKINALAAETTKYKL